tara:strand:+ start:37672 stop:38721 length:1050 start_codon:yes stop_codon:yes gene_type:complete
MSVLVAHITLGLEEFGLNPLIFGTYKDGNPRTLDLAGHGVSMFFVLSGFLITYLLWEEKDRQPIQIRKFYFRRMLRIWPLYYMYMLACIVSYIFYDLDVNHNSILYYVFFSANIPFIAQTTLPFLSHFWSLGVEEHFYLFWPWLNKFSKPMIKKLILILIGLLIGTKIYLHLFNPNSVVELAIHVTRFHCMLIGAYCSILFREKNRLFLTLSTNKIVQLTTWGIILLVGINRFHIASFLDTEFLSIVTAIIIIGQVTDKGIISLERPIFNFFGKISYGVYVIHPLLIFLLRDLLREVTGNVYANYVIVYGVIISSTIILSYLSYTYFESVFLRLKNKRFTVVRSSPIQK